MRVAISTHAQSPLSRRQDANGKQSLLSLLAIYISDVRCTHLRRSEFDKVAMSKEASTRGAALVDKGGHQSRKLELLPRTNGLRSICMAQTTLQTKYVSAHLPSQMLRARSSLPVPAVKT